MMGLAFCLILAGCCLIGDTAFSIMLAGGLILIGGLIVLEKTI